MLYWGKSKQEALIYEHSGCHSHPAQLPGIHRQAHQKRNFRQLWITRISAACKMNGMNYSNFMHGLKLAGVEINRKMLAEMAVNDKAAFTALTELSKAKLA